MVMRQRPEVARMFAWVEEGMRKELKLRKKGVQKS
jgi:hypothetical protein